MVSCVVGALHPSLNPCIWNANSHCWIQRDYSWCECMIDKDSNSRYCYWKNVDESVLCILMTILIRAYMASAQLECTAPPRAPDIIAYQHLWHKFVLHSALRCHCIQTLGAECKFREPEDQCWKLCIHLEMDMELEWWVHLEMKTTRCNYTISLVLILASSQISTPTSDCNNE